MHHEKNFDWFMKTELCKHTSYWSNVSTINGNKCFCVAEGDGWGVIFDVTGCCYFFYQTLMVEQKDKLNVCNSEQLITIFAVGE
jgi:hypothetical protein